MNDIMLYTYPQQDGKFRLINRLPLAGMEVGMKTFMQTSSVYSCIMVLGNLFFFFHRHNTNAAYINIILKKLKRSRLKMLPWQLTETK